MDDITRLMAERACERLMLDYFTHLSARDSTALAALFTQDAALARTGARALELRGRDEIAAFVSGIAPGGLKLYLALNRKVEVIDEQTAHGECLGLVIAADPQDGAGPPAASADGVVRYVDRFVREAGGWRIARRELSRLVTMALSG